jgi:hypothetical protein
MMDWFPGKFGNVGEGFMVLKIPMSPVSVVVFSMLSSGPGDWRKAMFSLTLLSGRRNDGSDEAGSKPARPSPA